MRIIKNQVKFSKSFLFAIISIFLIVGVIAPTTYLLISSSGDFPYFNQTEGTNLGARLSASVLSMDFNSPTESIPTYYNSTTATTQGTYIKDRSIYNNFGTTSGYISELIWHNNGSLINNSLQFDGVNDYVNVGLTTLTTVNKSLTVSAWINFNNYSSSSVQTIIAKSVSCANSGQFIFYVKSGTLKLDSYSDASGTQQSITVSGTPLSGLTGWHHVAFAKQWNSTNFTSIYIDGVNQSYTGDSLAEGTSYTTNNIWIGAYAGGCSATPLGPANGSIDDVIIWSRILNATEINTTYQNGLAGRTISFDTLGDNRIIPTVNKVNYYSFNTDLGGNVTDEWGSSNGTCLVASCPAYTANGIFGTGAYNFSNKHINITKTTLLNNFTIVGWVRIDSFSTPYAPMLSENFSGSGTIYNYSMVGFKSNSGYYLQMWCPGYATTQRYLTDSNMQPVLGQWTQFAITNVNSGTAGSVRGYLNGKASSVVNQVGCNNFTFDSMGQWSASGVQYYLNGGLDEIQVFNKTLSASEIADLYDQQRLHLKLDELNGTSATDSSSSNATGTLTNYPSATAPIWNATGGVSGSGAYVFDGVDDVITVTTPSLATYSDFSMGGWTKLNPTATSATYSMLYWTSGAPYMHDELGYTGGHYNRRIDYSLGGCTTLDVVVMTDTDSNWHYAMLTKQGSTVTLYWDGVNKSTCTTATTALSGTTLQIGNAANRIYNGTLDNMQIYSRALSASEILELYNGTYVNTTLKYSTKQGDFTSGVFYNKTQTYWNVSLATADTTNRSGLVNTDNSINISNPNLVSYWALDGNYLDGTGRNNGTCSGTTCPNNASGLTSGAMKFDGVDDYLNISNPSSFELGVNGNYSVSYWMQLAKTATQMEIWAKTNDTTLVNGAPTGARYSNIHTTGKIAFGVKGTGELTSTGTILDTNWHYVTLTKAGTNYTFYIDSINSGSGLIGMAADNNTLLTQFHIGHTGYAVSTVTYFNGSLDEFIFYNKTLNTTEVSQLYKSGLSQHANTNVTIQTRTANSYNVSDSSLVVLYGLNENSNTTVIDEAGHYNGTYINGSLSNESSGLVGSGGYFDGTNDYVNTSISNNLNSSAPFTVAGWFYSRSYATTIRSFFSQVNSSQRGWSLIHHTSYPGELDLLTANDCSTNYGNNRNSVINIVAGKWQHIVMTYNGSYVTYYVDGSTSGGYVKVIPNCGGVLKVGGETFAPYYWNGNIDEVRIYNRSLSASEVQDLYNLGSTHIGDWSAWSNPQTCYDNETQIQTESGWKLFSELNKTEKVATLNPETNEIEYKLPTEYQVYDAPEFMYKITTEEGEMIVSPDHKVYSSTTEKNNYWKLFGGIIFILIGILGLIKIIFDMRKEDGQN